MKTKMKLVTLLLSLSLLGLSMVYAEAPSLSLKDSLPLAEKALIQAKVDVGRYYIFSVVFTGSSKGDYWYYTYRPIVPSESNEIFVRVYMTGEAEISGGGLRNPY